MSTYKIITGGSAEFAPALFVENTKKNQSTYEERKEKTVMFHSTFLYILYIITSKLFNSFKSYHTNKIM